MNNKSIDLFLILIIKYIYKSKNIMIKHTKSLFDKCIDMSLLPSQQAMKDLSEIDEICEWKECLDIVNMFRRDFEFAFSEWWLEHSVNTRKSNEVNMLDYIQEIESAMEICIWTVNFILSWWNTKHRRYIEFEYGEGGLLKWVVFLEGTSIKQKPLTDTRRTNLNNVINSFIINLYRYIKWWFREEVKEIKKLDNREALDTLINQLAGK